MAEILPENWSGWDEIKTLGYSRHCWIPCFSCDTMGRLCNQGNQPSSKQPMFIWLRRKKKSLKKKKKRERCEWIQRQTAYINLLNNTWASPHPAALPAEWHPSFGDNPPWADLKVQQWISKLHSAPAAPVASQSLQQAKSTCFWNKKIQPGLYRWAGKWQDPKYHTWPTAPLLAYFRDQSSGWHHKLSVQVILKRWIQSPWDWGGVTALMLTGFESGPNLLNLAWAASAYLIQRWDDGIRLLEPTFASLFILF